ncbi:LysR family transcriptional regulator [Mesorhizobium sp. B2-6-2]|uniref:LysR family transcriptional regulator n=1 Tax=Mesorhizobium sp. B2-6-2 TaxID=2589915 RepID=UPI00112DCC7A|nr:LysR family transcriptional regulator [Mesorhizobium sp. B2-6-2]TPJ73163.1 LysR family transcriptional regulator [Mesorhizobium sp. B2-6-2]
MDGVKLHDLRCFDAVARRGSFQAAAQALHRTHPSVFAAVARLEEQLGLTLLDRSGYRVSLTDEGRLFHARAQLTIREFEHLRTYAGQLASGEETMLRVVMGDVCPRPRILGLLSRFFAERPRTRLHLDYEAIGGPVERLMDGEADLVFHPADLSDPHLERIGLCEVAFVPVVAPGFLPFDPRNDVAPEAMRPFTQCVIRDTTRRPSPENFFVIDGAHSCSVPDHMMKKELILHGLAWGHLPDWLIEDDLRDGRLISIAGRHIPGRSETVAAVRRRDKPHGPVAEALWRHLQAQSRAQPVAHG